MSVPYHTLDLDEKLSYRQDKADGNLIIEGDNLPALKSLLPQYTGKVDCIYIDPPYNTGNEGWVYNDNVNSPLVKEWIGKEVGSDDLTRHDKWLSMMTPRLKLMRELLTEDGVIFISLDDNEIHRLRDIMDEIFTNENFKATFLWKKKGTTSNVTGAEVSSLTEYILCYSKTTKAKLNPRVRSSETREYSYNDDEGSYRLSVIEKKNTGSYKRDSMQFEILGQKPRRGKRWQIGKDKALALEEKGRFVKGDDGIVRLKIYNFEEEDSLSAQPNLLDIYGTTDSASRELREFLGEDRLFENPKPVTLLKHLISLSPNKDGIILDAFAGSGTTAQAVLELNEEDESSRKFILIQMPENSEKEPKKNIARDITRERVVKVIEKKLENIDIGFEYRRVGQPIDAETILSGELPTFKQLAKYVYYLATGQSPKDKDIDEKKYLAGKVDHTEVYLLYTPDMEELKKMAITFEWAKEISKGNENKKIVYAPACFMDDEYLEQFNIKFVSIPYNLFEREK